MFTLIFSLLILMPDYFRRYAIILFHAASAFAKGHAAATLMLSLHAIDAITPRHTPLPPVYATLMITLIATWRYTDAATL